MTTVLPEFVCFYKKYTYIRSGEPNQQNTVYMNSFCLHLLLTKFPKNGWFYVHFAHKMVKRGWQELAGWVLAARGMNLIIYEFDAGKTWRAQRANNPNCCGNFRRRNSFPFVISVVMLVTVDYQLSIASMIQPCFSINI